MQKAMKIEKIREMINSFPRVPLAHLPTPLQEVPRFSRAINGPRIFIKRDDLTGLAFGGNKTRMFEFLLGKAKEEGADTIVGGAGVQSNYCRQLAAACNSLGFEVHLVLRRLRGKRDDEIQGNLLLDLLMGATVTIIDSDANGQRQAMYDLADRLKTSGKRPFVARMARGEDLTPDVIAYVNCFCEIQEQCEERGIHPKRLYVSSYDSTQAGLELGRALLQNPMKIFGISPGVWENVACRLVSKYANQAASALKVECEINTDEVYNTIEYVGENYGVPTREGNEMLKLMARTEGIFLDPVYTGKAMAAVYDHLEKGEISSDDVVVFLHTGGTPALFAYADELDLEELNNYLHIV